MKRSLAMVLCALGTGMAALAQAPAITAVLDAAAYSANIPQGAVFVVKGSNLASSSVFGTTPYGKSMNGVSVSFAPVAGGAAVQTYMVYTYSSGGVTQLAALLPSDTATGDYNVTVTTSGVTSAPFKATVVARKFGIMTQAGSGSGRALLQNVVTSSQYDLNAFTSGSVPGQSFQRSPAKPGEFVIVWGIGMGAAVGFDSTAPPSGLDFRSSLDVKAIVGSKTLSTSYAGRSNLFPGLDNVGFQLPADVDTGCAVNVQITVNGQPSNATTLSIAPNSAATACVDPTYDATTLTRLDTGGNLTIGFFQLFSITTKITVQGQTINTTSESIGGTFTRYSADQLSSIQRPPSTGTLTASGTCQVYHSRSSSAGGGVPVDATNLDAGTITLNGPNVSNKVVTNTKNVYSLTLSSSGLPGGIQLPGVSSTPVITAGQYTLDGAGGADVNAFHAALNINQPLTITGNGLPTTIVRSQNLPIAWTGGGTDVVYVSGTSSFLFSGTATNNPVFDSTSFICYTTADKGSLTVPSSILSQLPAVSADALANGTGYGALSVYSGNQPTASNGLFTAPLKAGGTTDYAYFLAAVGSSANVSYQ